MTKATELAQFGGLVDVTGTGNATKVGIGTTIDITGGAYISGNVGIGITNPNEILCVSKTSPDPYNTVLTHLKLINGAGNGGAGNRIEFVNVAATAWIQSFVSGANSTSGSDLVFGTPSTGTVGTERLRITSSGNVGIGTTNPSAKLHVSDGKLLVTDENGGQPMLQIRNFATSSTGSFSDSYGVEIRHASTGTQTHGALIHLAESVDNRRTLDISDATGTVASFVNGKVLIKSTTATGTASQTLQVTGGAYVSGNVGIGITNPTEKLHVRDGRLLIETGGLNTYGVISGYQNHNHLHTFRANITGSTNSPTFTLGHQMCFVEYAEANDSTGWFFKTSETGTYDTVFKISRSNITYPSGNVGIGITNPSEKLEVAGKVIPSADNTHDLGSSSRRWANIFSADLQLSNEGSQNDVDGTWGNYTIQEGEEDLFLINRRTGKKYKFLLEEVQ